MLVSPLVVKWFCEKLHTFSNLETHCFLETLKLSNSFTWAFFQFARFHWWSFHVWNLFSLLGQPSATHFPFSFKTEPCHSNPSVEEQRQGKGGKMVIELRIKVLQVLNAQGQHWVPIGLPLKDSFVSPSSWFYVVTFPFTTLFSILTSTSLSCLSLVFCWRVRCTRHSSG